ncbi:MAG: hypothetical protein JW939_01050 [Candidatus Thermoplasmatota archaeon]|nr:hypothetical protein [Candidatus Thermoplasmatota archaeon]
MTLPKLSEQTVRVVVVVFSLVGMAVLGIIAAVTEVERIRVAEAADHSGERVEVVGSVIGSATSASGSSWVLIMEENVTMEVFIENGRPDIEPGTLISVEGEITMIGGDPVLTVQKVEDIRVEERSTVQMYEGNAVPGIPYCLKVMVRSSTHTGWIDQEVVAIPLGGNGLEELPVFLTVNRLDMDLRPGDILNLTAVFTGPSSGMVYGDLNCELLARAEVLTTSLLWLVNEMRSSPSSAPIDPITLEGYIKYPPGGKTVYISEMVEGGEISVRVRLPQERSDISMGDLVRLFNCSFSWDVEGMRMELIAEESEILDVHGPWRLNLGSMEWGLLDFVDCRVVISGAVEVAGNSTRIVQDGVSLEVRNYTGPIGYGDTKVTGKLLYDEVMNTLYLESEAVAS